MRKILYALLILPLVLSTSCESLKKEKAVVTASVLNVRKFASKRTQVVGQLNKGDTVIIQRSTNGFAEIEHNGSEGYVSLNYLNKGERSEIQSHKDIDSGAVFVLILLLSLLSWGLARLGNVILWKMTLYKTHYISGFNFSTLVANRNKRRISFLINTVLGRKRQHPYLTFWVYIAFYFILLPTLFLFPFSFMDAFGNHGLTLKAANLEVRYPVLLVWLFISVGGPIAIYLIKAGINIRREGGRNEWFAVFAGVLLALPVVVITMFLALITFIKYVLLAFVIMLRIFTPTRNQWRYINDMNSDHPYDVPNF